MVNEYGSAADARAAIDRATTYLGRPGYERDGVRIVNDWEYSHRRCRDADSAVRYANTSEWELVSVVNDPMKEPKTHWTAFREHEEELIAFYRRRTR